MKYDQCNSGDKLSADDGDGQEIAGAFSQPRRRPGNGSDGCGQLTCFHGTSVLIPTPAFACSYRQCFGTRECCDCRLHRPQRKRLGYAFGCIRRHNFFRRASPRGTSCGVGRCIRGGEQVGRPVKQWQWGHRPYPFKVVTELLRCAVSSTPAVIISFRPCMRFRA